MKQEQHTTYPVFPRIQSFVNTRIVDIEPYWRKYSTKQTIKKPWRVASWTKHIHFSKPRLGGQGLAGDTVCACSLDRPGKQAVTAMLPVHKPSHPPVLAKGTTLGFPVRYVSLLTEMTQAKWLVRNSLPTSPVPRSSGIRGLTTVKVRHLNSVHGLTVRLLGKGTKISYHSNQH